VSEREFEGLCSRARTAALDGVESITVSPDGTNAYGASRIGAVAMFDRTRNGRLIQKPGTAGCISGHGDGPCIDGTALGTPDSVAVSPDGQSAYVTASTSGAVAVFDRAPNGTLAQKPGTAGCIRDVAGAGRCADGTALASAASVAVSPDGQNAYIASRVSDAVAVFDREPSPPPRPDTTTPLMSGLDRSPDLSPTLRR
jgi:6-phosphogluconolactonase (cycloisomerase 2 family)